VKLYQKVYSTFDTHIYFDIHEWVGASGEHHLIEPWIEPCQRTVPSTVEESGNSTGAQGEGTIASEAIKGSMKALSFVPMQAYLAYNT